MLFTVLVSVLATMLVLSRFQTADATEVCAPPVASPAKSELDRWNEEQVANARTIVAIGAERKVPVQGQVIAVATALQESTLRNLRGGDRDSIGLFQQRPSQGWGTPKQLRDPAYQTGKFYDKLLKVRNWQDMRLTEAAQAVQISAFPEAYAKHTGTATRLVSELSPAACP
ncbi:peptidase M23 [Actinoplanes couchii]|uniref:peptidase M23 n=1 Tax=Actinoplanes couchii TaxID=403638 RepID=UPI0027DDA3A5|nr:peptidase M23 [Actinoplanes couchii]